NVTVAVDANRVNGIHNLIRICGNEKPVILLDDVFQHRSVRAGLNILVTEFNNLYYKDNLLPAGRLREPAAGMIRADVIVVTKTPDHTTSIDRRANMIDLRRHDHQ